MSEIHYEIAVKRKPLFYMVTVTFPSYVMCAISIVGLFARFSTNGERQERFSLGVTAILTSAVLSLVVSEKVFPYFPIFYALNGVLSEADKYFFRQESNSNEKTLFSRIIASKVCFLRCLIALQPYHCWVRVL